VPEQGPHRRAAAHRALSVRRLAAAACVLAALGVSHATAQLPGRHAPRGAEGHRDRAGDFSYYVLVLSWSPTFCAAERGRRFEPQCERSGARSYGFVLHGLWPQFERGWPQSCWSADRGYVPEAVARQMLDIMPSRPLIFHEYRAHGTCSGLGPQRYFALARALFEKIVIPERYRAPSDPRLTVARDELVRDFIAVNPGLEPDMIALACRGPGERLKDVRICFDRDGQFRRCGANEDQGALCVAQRLYVPALR
jgi:ribonuclease T2